MRLNIIIGALILGLLVPWALGAAEKEFAITGFNEIDFNAPGKLYLSQSQAYAVKVEGTRDQIPEVTIRKKRNRLSIRKKVHFFGWGSESLDSVAIFVALPQIAKISVGSSGSVFSQSRFDQRDDVVVSASSSGNVELDISAPQITAKGTSAGYILIRGEADTLSLRSSSSGDIGFIGVVKNYLEATSTSNGDILCQLSPEVTINDSRFELRSSGNLVAIGASQRVQASLSSSGDLNMKGFVCQDLDARLSSSGSLSAIVTYSLNADLSSSGNLYFLGKPQIRANSTSSGRVLPLRDK